MQESPVPHSAVSSIAYWLVTFLSGGAGGGVLAHLLSRRRANLESEANVAKARAEARHLDSETIDRAYDRIDELHDIVDELRGAREKDRLEILRLSQVEYLGAQMREQLERQKIELQLADEQLKRVKGLLDAHGIKLSDLDKVE